MAGRKLKVFQAQLGFYDSVVAAPSQAAALRAWGVRQDLFASGHARVADNAQAIKAALAQPQTPLKRAVGSKDPFGLEAGLPKVTDAPKPKPAARKAAKAVSAPAEKPADRRALDAAEVAVKTLDEARKHEEAGLRRERERLDAKTAEAQAAYVSGRKAATAAIVRARQAYREAGGRD